MTPGAMPGAMAARDLHRSAKSMIAATSHAGGRTRTPDTRIMIPLRFGSVLVFEGAGGPKRGQECAWRHAVGLVARALLSERARADPASRCSVLVLRRGRGPVAEAARMQARAE